MDDIIDIEEGELDDSSEDDTRTPSPASGPVKRRKQQREAQKSYRPKNTVQDHVLPDRKLASPVPSDDEQTLTVDMDDLETFGVSKQKKPKIYENKQAGSFELGFDLTSKEAQAKKLERAKRFGIEPTSEKIDVGVDEEKINLLYDSLGVRNVDFGERGIRLDAVHLRGVDRMNTEDIFQYFQDFAPKFIEWIDDASCNVLWSGELEAARAMMAISEDPNETTRKKSSSDENKENESKQDKEEVHKEEKMDVDDDELNLMSSDEEDKTTDNSRQNKTVTTEPEAEDGEIVMEEKKVSDSNSRLHSSSNVLKRILPPGNWRVGKPHPKAKFLFMRFANKADKKLAGAERRSDYYRRYGNPNYGGMKGLISSSRKRRFRNDMYRQESDEAREVVREAERYKYGSRGSKTTSLEEVSFDEQLQQAQRACKLREAREAKNTGEGNSDQIAEYDGDDDFDPRRGMSENEEEQKNDEEELDLELELNELMKKAPVYRVGRMYADDLEDQIRAKREAAQELANEMVSATDVRWKIADSRYKRKYTIGAYYDSYAAKAQQQHIEYDRDIEEVEEESLVGKDEKMENYKIVVENPVSHRVRSKDNSKHHSHKTRHSPTRQQDRRNQKVVESKEHASYHPRRKQTGGKSEKSLTSRSSRELASASSSNRLRSDVERNYHPRSRQKHEARSQQVHRKNGDERMHQHGRNRDRLHENAVDQRRKNIDERREKMLRRRRNMDEHHEKISPRHHQKESMARNNKKPPQESRRRKPSEDSQEESDSSESDEDSDSSSSSSSSSASSSSHDNQPENKHTIGRGEVHSSKTATRNAHKNNVAVAEQSSDDGELDLGEEEEEGEFDDDEEEILKLNDPVNKDDFKYEKLRIHVEQDDI